MKSNPEVYNWHHKPREFAGACPVCGFSANVLIQHRKVAKGENLTAVWLARYKTRAGWMFKSWDNNGRRMKQSRPTKPRPAKPRPRSERGGKPTDKTAVILRKAAELFSQGSTFKEIARALKMHYRAIVDLREVHRALWATYLNESMETAKTEIRKAAGRKPTAANSNIPPAKMHRVMDYCDARGESVLPRRNKTAKITLSDLFENYYAPQRLVGCSPRTLEDYRCTINRFRKFLMKQDAEISDLNDATLSRYLASILKDGLTPETANHNRRCLLALWQFARKRKMISAEPDVERLRENRRAPKAWDMQEFGRIIEAAKKSPDRPAWWEALLLTAYDTGLRIGALLKIRPEYIDAAKGWLRVPAETQKQKADQVFQLHPDTLAAIQKVKPAEGLLFFFPYNRHVLYVHFRKIVNAAGVPVDIGGGTLFHRIRKTTATHIADSLGEAAAMSYLGHSALSVTKRYLDPTKIHRVQAVDVLPRPIFSA